MPRFYQMTGRGPANAAGQAVAMQGVRGRSGVTKAAPPGPLCCTLWAFLGVAPLRADVKVTVKLLSGLPILAQMGLVAAATVPGPLSRSRGVAFPCSLSAVRAPLKSRHCSKHHRPLQILPYLSELLQQAIPRLSAARRHALKQ